MDFEGHKMTALWVAAFVKKYIYPTGCFVLPNKVLNHRQFLYVLSFNHIHWRCLFLLSKRSYKYKFKNLEKIFCGVNSKRSIDFGTLKWTKAPHGFEIKLKLIKIIFLMGNCCCLNSWGGGRERWYDGTLKFGH